MVQEFNKNWIKNQKSAYEMVKEFVDAQEIKLKENNMEDRNKTAVELIADLQNQLDKANNRIEELVKENNKLKELNNTQFENLHDLRLGYNGLFNKFHALDIEHAALIGKYCEYNQAAQDAWNENNKIKKEIEKLKNENEYLEWVIDWLISENDDMSKEIAKWHNKYTKEKAKHDKATKKIDELKKHQKDELTWSYKRRHDNSEKNEEVEKLIENLQKQLIQKKNEYAELYDELKHDEKLLENDANMDYMINNVKLFIDTYVWIYEMLKNGYLKGYITEDDFFCAMDSNANRMKKAIKTGGIK